MTATILESRTRAATPRRRRAHGRSRLSQAPAPRAIVAPRSVEGAVRRWLDTRAPVVLTVVMGFEARASHLSVGPIAREYQWTAAFLDGRADATPVRPINQWSAPLFETGRLAGVVSVRLDADCSIRIAHVSRDLAAAQALAGREPTSRYVCDLINGAFLVEGSYVRQIGATAARPVALAAAQRVFVAQQRELRRAAREMDGSVAGCPEPVDLLAG